MQYITENIYAILAFTHVITLLLVVVFILLADSMAFKWWRGAVDTLSPSKLKLYHNAILVGLLLMIFSGAWLVILKGIDKSLANPFFQIKMVFVATLIVNSFVIGSLMNLATKTKWVNLPNIKKIFIYISASVSMVGWVGAAFSGYHIKNIQPNIDASRSAVESMMAEAIVGDKASTTKTYTLVDIQDKNNEKECWTTINAKVYNITKYVPLHPGGRGAIMNICGKDGTSLFMRKHGGDEKPNMILRSMQVGVVK